MMVHFKLALPAAISGSLLFIVGCSDPSMQQEMEQAAPGSQAGGQSDQEQEIAAGSSQAAGPYIDKGFLAHNQARSYIVGGCWFTVQHGNYLGAAYAKIMSHTAGCIVKPKVTAIANGQWASGYGPYARQPGIWTQAQVTYANIVGSEFIVNQWTVAFSGI
jgi:hypothetical protein